MVKKEQPAEKGYLVRVAGEYITMDGHKNRVTQNYELEFKLPRMDAALSIIKNKLLMPALKKAHPGAIGYRTHEIVDYKPLGKQIDGTDPYAIDTMSRAKLIKHIRQEGLKVQENLYPKIGDLRDAIAMYEADPVKYKQKEKALREEIKADQELAAMNPDIADTITAHKTPIGAVSGKDETAADDDLEYLD